MAQCYTFVCTFQYRCNMSCGDHSGDLTHVAGHQGLPCVCAKLTKAIWDAYKLS